jgi:hypothetical protein
MPSKYHTETASGLITNDLYLAAFLRSVGCELDHVERNERRRISFVFRGERAHAQREAYRRGPVRLDMRRFRESLYHMRHLMAGAQKRSDACPTRSPRALSPV